LACLSRSSKLSEVVFMQGPADCVVARCGSVQHNPSLAPQRDVVRLVE
jgi:hypothetical protein